MAYIELLQNNKCPFSSFKMDRSPCLDDWEVEFFINFFVILYHDLLRVAE